MTASLFKRSFIEHRRSMLWWAIGIALLTLLYTVLYPSIKDVLSELDQFPDELLQALGLEAGVELGTAAGYLEIELFSLTAPIVLIVYGVVMGVGAVAGSERRGEMELLLANPLPRSAVFTQRFAAMLVTLIGAAFVVWASVAIGIPFDVWSDLNGWNLVQICISLVLLGWTFGAIAIGVSAASGSTGLTYAITGAIAVATFVIYSFSEIVEEIQWMKWLSPFFYYRGSRPLSDGLEWWHTLIPLGITVLAYFVGRVMFDRRDLKSPG